MATNRLDYSRWDHIGEEEEVLEAKANVDEGLSDDLGEALDESREKMRSEVLELLKRRYPEKPVEFCQTTAYFVAVQRRDPGTACNHNRHVEIIKLLAKLPSLSSDETTEALCQIASDRFEEKDNNNAIFLVEAVNTLEAARIFDGALAFFKEICPPTTHRANRMRDEYAKQTYGQLRLKRFVYRKLLKEDPSFYDILLEHENKTLASIDPALAPTLRKNDKKKHSFLSTTWWRFLFPCFVVTVFALYGRSVVNKNNNENTSTSFDHDDYLPLQQKDNTDL